ncbi:hypothetical protein Tco_1263137 [Tanacetum coccineum]
MGAAVDGSGGGVDDEGGVTVVAVVWRRGDDGCGVASVGGGDDDGSDGVRLKKMMVVAGPWPESGRNMAGKKGRRRKNNMERGKLPQRLGGEAEDITRRTKSVSQVSGKTEKLSEMSFYIKLL